MKKYFIALLIFTIFLGCKKENSKVEMIVAKVNDVSLTENQMKNYFTKSQWDTLSIKSKRDFINNWINLTVLENKADELELSKKPIIKSRIESAIKKVKANALLANEISNININENEEYSFYKIHKKEFGKKITKYALQEIVVNTKEMRDTVLFKLNNRIPFKEVARKYSQNKYAKSGGLVGYVSKTDVDSKIWNKLNSLKKYYYTSLKINDKYYIIRYYGKNKFIQYNKFKDVQKKIKNTIIKNKKKELYRNFINKLKAQSKILISI